ncbi:hypothetical protein [Fluviicoccus keumensis]|uniref:hypothetical protein n=1 Tax=Fluviicoccus keumensis TaxID=1435465 RepID=UPI00102B6FCA|nr:hypothetical protein [Fluviicoccus keumensis]
MANKKCYILSVGVTTRQSQVDLKIEILTGNAEWRGSGCRTERCTNRKLSGGTIQVTSITGPGTTEILRRWNSERRSLSAYRESCNQRDAEPHMYGTATLP